MVKSKSVAPISSPMLSQSSDLKGKKSNFTAQASLLQSLSNEQSQLPKCKKEYQHKQSLHKHIKKTHNQDGNEMNTIKCKKKECTFSCRYMKQLRQHLNKHHNFIIKTLSTMQDLL